MSILNTIPTPVVQMGLVEKLVELEQNQPHVHQLQAQESARQTLKAQKERISEVDHTEQGKKVRDREAGQERKGNQPPGHQRFGEESDDETAAEDAPRKTAPWAGHLVNIKI